MAGKRIRRKRAAQPRGLEASALTGREPPAAVQALAWQIEKDNGSVIGIYRDPLGGHWQILAGLPADAVQPTPYQRDLSATHVARLAAAIESLGRFLDPIIAVPAPEGGYWTPNGHHRLAALKELGAKSVVALVVPEVEVARRILLLNTEKAHNLRERSLEVVRLEERQARASLILELNEAVNEVVKQLKDRGFQSPYLKSFVVARVNPLRFKRGAKAEFEETIGKMLAGARRFDVSKVRPEQLARAAGPPEEE